MIFIRTVLSLSILLASVSSCSFFVKNDSVDGEQPTFLVPDEMRERIDALESQGFFVIYHESIGNTKESALLSAETGVSSKISEAYSSEVRELKQKYVDDLNLESSSYTAQAIEILSHQEITGVHIDGAYTMISKIKQGKYSKNAYSVKVIGYFDLQSIYVNATKEIKNESTLAKAKEMFEKLTAKLVKVGIKSAIGIP